jgi:hypothetical protein
MTITITLDRMTITIILTVEERKLIHAFAVNPGHRVGVKDSNYIDLSGSPAWTLFRDAGIIKDCYPAEGFIYYKLTELGEIALRCNPIGYVPS